MPTSLHCDNPFIWELLNRHGKGVNFRGVILSRGYNDSFEQKKKMGLWVARLAKTLDADGALAFMEGTTTARSISCRPSRHAKMKASRPAAVLHESNGPKVLRAAAVDHPEEADGMISRGNVSEKIYFPPLASVIGGPEIDLHLKARHDARVPFSSTRRFLRFLQQNGHERFSRRYTRM